MPFKIVQTTENNQLKLTAVPDLWEHNNVLFWPNKSAEKLRRKENCPPDASWSIMPCTVKRNNLKTFQEADHEIDAMSDRSETETENESYARTNRYGRNKTCVLPKKSFNDIAETLLESRDPECNKATLPVSQKVNYIQTSTSSADSQQKSDTIQLELNTTDLNYNPVSHTPGIVSEEPQLETSIAEGLETLDDRNYVFLNTDGPMQQFQDDQIQQLKNDIKSIKDDIRTIILNQNSLYEIQANMSSTLAEIKNELSAYIQLTASKKKEEAEVDLIKSLKEFEEFDKNLADTSFKETLMKKLAAVCPKISGKGAANAYYLIDSVFDRTFLKECTWTGLSKDETGKICFKSFKRTISFFFDIVHESDKTFTKTECDKFFKTVLKNARQRSESYHRMSAPKMRNIKRKPAINNLPGVRTEIVNDQLVNEELPNDIEPTNR